MSQARIPISSGVSLFLFDSLSLSLSLSGSCPLTGVLLLTAGSILTEDQTLLQRTALTHYYRGTNNCCLLSNIYVYNMSLVTES